MSQEHPQDPPAPAPATEPVHRGGLFDRGAGLPFVLMLASLAILYGVTAWAISPQVERWIACRAAYPWIGSALLILHHAVGTPGFALVWAASFLLLCSQVGGRQFRLMMFLNLILCALAAVGAAGAMFLSAQRCG